MLSTVDMITNANLNIVGRGEINPLLALVLSSLKKRKPLRVISTSQSLIRMRPKGGRKGG